MKRTYEGLVDLESWFDWCKSLLELYTTEKQVMVDDTVHLISHTGMKRWIASHKYKGTEFLLKTLLLDSVVSADKVPGAGSYVPWFLYNSENNLQANRLSSAKYLENTISLTRSSLAKKIFRAVHKISGPLTRISVKKGTDKNIIIKTRNSFNFKMKLDPLFYRSIGNHDQLEINNPIVVMIEGAPETIAEIHPLLIKNSEDKRPILLIARNFPEEISASLATNWLRNSLTILPFVYGNELETINLASDICAVTKGELISPHFGDVISVAVLDEDKWGSVDRVIWNPYGLSIYSNVNVSSHINKLIQRSKKADSEELRGIIENRILSLSNDSIEVWIPKSNFKTIEELDSLLKHYAAFVSSGAVKTSLGILPKSFVDSAVTSAAAFKKEILNIGGFLVRADDEQMVSR